MSHLIKLPRLSGTAKTLTAGLLGAVLLLTPLVASAETTSSTPSMYHHHVWGKTAAQREETVEQRITMLHTNLHITADEETQWGAVATVMRSNEAHMQDMIAAREAEPAHHVNALEDLRVYERFTQAHVDGLKALRVSFETLYNAMPADQQLVADDVFAKFGNSHD